MADFKKVFNNPSIITQEKPIRITVYRKITSIKASVQYVGIEQGGSITVFWLVRVARVFSR